MNKDIECNYKSIEELEDFLIEKIVKGKSENIDFYKTMLLLCKQKENPTDISCYESQFVYVFFQVRKKDLKFVAREELNINKNPYWVIDFDIIADHHIPVSFNDPYGTPCNAIGCTHNAISSQTDDNKWIEFQFMCINTPPLKWFSNLISYGGIDFRVTWVYDTDQSKVGKLEYINYDIKETSDYPSHLNNSI